MPKYNCGKYVCTLSPELQERTRVELNEDPARREQAIEILRTWIIKEPHINGRTDDTFLLRHLRTAKFSIERAKERIENYYTMKTAIPEWFITEGITSSRVQEILKLGVMLPLGYDREGRQVMLTRIGSYDPSEYKLDEIFGVCYLVAEMNSMDEQAQINGVVFLSDLTGMSGGLVAQFSPLIAKKAMSMWQDSMPIRIKGFHYYKTSVFFDTVFAMVKVFMKEKLQKRVIFHGSKLDSLHAMYPVDILPTEYGGTAGTLASIVAKVVKNVNDNLDYFEEDVKYRVDESKRLGKPKTQEDLFGVDGTFRKLNID